jgi:hypothetical protein
MERSTSVRGWVCTTGLGWWGSKGFVGTIFGRGLAGKITGGGLGDVDCGSTGVETPLGRGGRGGTDGSELVF